MRYSYYCPECGWTGIRDVPVDDRNLQACECGKPLSRDIGSDLHSTSICIPLAMQAKYDNGRDTIVTEEDRATEEPGRWEPKHAGRWF